MKRLLTATVIILSLALAACDTAATPAEVASPLAAQSAMRTTVETESPTDSPSPPPVLFVPDTNIPDDLGLPDDTLASSSDYFESCIREDKNNIYYTRSIVDNEDEVLSLFCVNKETGGITTVSDDIYSFALCSGKVYYTPSDKSGCAINSYDPVTGKTRQIKKFKNSVYDMASYKGKLYFTYETVYHEDYDIPLTDLYVMNPDGSGQKKIRGNIASFCIYNNIIYYYESSWPDGAPLDSCNLNGSGQKNIVDWTDYFTAVCNNKIYYFDGSNDISIDICSGDKVQLPSFLNGTGDYYYSGFAPLGKYILRLSNNPASPNITAFNTETNRTYNIIELEKDNYYDIYTSPYGAYLVSGGSSFDLYRLVIENGKACIKLVASYKAPPSENPAPTAGPEPTPALAPTAAPEPYQSAY